MTVRCRLLRLTSVGAVVLVGTCGELETPPESQPLGLTSCHDGNPCTDDTWAESLGRCIFIERDDIACDDDDPCTLADRCVRGFCIGCGEADTPECACRGPQPQDTPYAKIADALCSEEPTPPAE